MLSDNDEPQLVAQSVVALPYQSDFSTYLDLSLYAKHQAPGATGPTAVHWNASSISEIDGPEAWKRTVITKMIDRLFSDGSFLDYEASLAQLEEAS